MALIRHNTRESERGGGGQYAHDTTRQDVKGCYVSGRSDRIVTSPRNPCPECGGWGALVPINKLARNDYPKGSMVPIGEVLGEYAPGPLSETWDPNAQGEVVAIEHTEVRPQPVVETGWRPTCQACGGHVNVMTDGICQGCRQEVREQVEQEVEQAREVREQVAREVSVPTAKQRANVPVTEVSDAGKAIADLLGIQQQIDNAVTNAIETAREESHTTITAGIALMEERFQKAVEAIVAPHVVVVENRNVPNAEPKTIVGAHKAFEKCLRWLEARDRKGMTKNLFLVGPTGSGKTTLAMQLAEALDQAFFTTGQVLGEHQVTGYVDANGEYHETPFYYPFVHGGLWLGDEFDGWSPEAALSMNAALANGVATFPNNPHPVNRNDMFYCIVAGNTWGKGADMDYVGRNQMDAASLRRYVKIFVDYDKELETRIGADHMDYVRKVWTCRDRARELKIQETFSTGEIEMGCDALRAGMDMTEIVDTILRRDMDDAKWRKLEMV